MENKILVCVDDVLLYITNPDLLDTFGTDADYTYSENPSNNVLL